MSRVEIFFCRIHYLRVRLTFTLLLLLTFSLLLFVLLSRFINSLFWLFPSPGLLLCYAYSTCTQNSIIIVFKVYMYSYSILFAYYSGLQLVRL